MLKRLLSGIIAVTMIMTLLTVGAPTVFAGGSGSMDFESYTSLEAGATLVSDEGWKWYDSNSTSDTFTLGVETDAETGATNRYGIYTRPKLNEVLKADNSYSYDKSAKQGVYYDFADVSYDGIATLKLRMNLSNLYADATHPLYVALFSDTTANAKLYFRTSNNTIRLCTYSTGTALYDNQKCVDKSIDLSKGWIDVTLKLNCYIGRITAIVNNGEDEVTVETNIVNYTKENLTSLLGSKTNRVVVRFNESTGVAGSVWIDDISIEKTELHQVDWATVSGDTDTVIESATTQLPTEYEGLTIKWSGSEYVSEDGVVTHPEGETVTADLTATFYRTADGTETDDDGDELVLAGRDPAYADATFSGITIAPFVYDPDANFRKGTMDFESYTDLDEGDSLITDSINDGWVWWNGTANRKREDTFTLGVDTDAETDEITNRYGVLNRPELNPSINSSGETVYDDSDRQAARYRFSETGAGGVAIMHMRINVDDLTNAGTQPMFIALMNGTTPYARLYIRQNSLKNVQLSHFSGSGAINGKQEVEEIELDGWVDVTLKLNCYIGRITAIVSDGTDEVTLQTNITEYTKENLDGLLATNLFDVCVNLATGVYLSGDVLVDDISLVKPRITDLDWRNITGFKTAEVASNVTQLPTEWEGLTIKWSGSDYVSADGVVTHPEDAAATANLTATFYRAAASDDTDEDKDGLVLAATDATVSFSGITIGVKPASEYTVTGAYDYAAGTLTLTNNYAKYNKAATVIAACYDENGLKQAKVYSIAANADAEITISSLALNAVTGNKIKLFLWTEGELQPIDGGIITEKTVE